MSGVSCKLAVSRNGEGLTWILLLLLLHTEVLTIGSNDSENVFYKRQSEVSLMCDSKQQLLELRSISATTNRSYTKLIWHIKMLTRELISNDTRLSLITSRRAGSKSV